MPQRPQRAKRGKAQQPPPGPQQGDEPGTEQQQQQQRGPQAEGRPAGQAQAGEAPAAAGAPAATAGADADEVASPGPDGPDEAWPAPGTLLHFDLTTPEGFAGVPAAARWWWRRRVPLQPRQAGRSPGPGRLSKPSPLCPSLLPPFVCTAQRTGRRSSGCSRCRRCRMFPASSPTSPRQVRVLTGRAATHVKEAGSSLVSRRHQQPLPGASRGPASPAAGSTACPPA